MAAEDQYPACVASLLELGEPRCVEPQEWQDYRAFCIGPEDIPALICLATDLDLLNDPDESDKPGWGPVHAWRALGQLRAVQAIDPLVTLFHAVPDNDWIIEEMPDVFALIGPPAFARLAGYLADHNRPTYARLIAATSLMQMAQVWPELRDQSVDALVEQLAGYRGNSVGVNSVLIANLIELQAVEQTDLIHSIFVEGRVDRFIVGDWRDVRHLLANNSHQVIRSSASSLAANIKKISPNPLEPSVDSNGAGSAALEPRTQPRKYIEPHSRPRPSSA